MKSLLLVILCIGLVNGVVDGRRIISNTDRERAIEEKLKQLNKPAVKTIQSEDGDTIDCVDIHQQPAFDHPLLKNHTIQMRPSDKVLKLIAESPTASNVGQMPTQVWQKSGSCPEGTIPILRIQRRHLEKAPSIENYGRKPWHGVTKHRIPTSNSTTTFDVSLGNLQETAVLVGEGYSYTGAAANLNLWNPYVSGFQEFSSSQIWIRNGPYDNADSIETGWIVSN
ncbi:protein neprosin-like [Typha latifolia]|uniref:protein neprosin-like n=1 Tax=Typha latifolia TaxID=4733 RepID=UPI003C2E8B55